MMKTSKVRAIAAFNSKLIQLRLQLKTLKPNGKENMRKTWKDRRSSIRERSNCRISRFRRDLMIYRRQ